MRTLRCLSVVARWVELICTEMSPVSCHPSKCQSSKGNWNLSYLISKFQFICSQHQNVIIQRQNCFRFYLVVRVKPSIITQVKPNIIHGSHYITAPKNPNPLIYSCFIKKRLRQSAEYNAKWTLQQVSNLLLSLLWRVCTTFRGFVIFGHDDAVQRTTEHHHTYIHISTGWYKKTGTFWVKKGTLTLRSSCNFIKCWMLEIFKILSQWKSALYL